MNFFKYLSFIGVYFLFLLSVSVKGAIDVHEFDTENQNDRFQGLVHELRCPKCQNQNLAESNSAISIDLRNQVAKLVSEGQTDKEVKEYMVQRYGEFVLYKPPVKSSTIVLWLAPAAMLLLAMLVFVFVISRRSSVSEELIEAGEVSDVGNNKKQ